MADRTVYGHNFSENGWRMVDQGSCRWVKVPGTNVTLQIREGQPVAIMGAFAADYNVHIEPLRDNDSACWTPTNSVATSNHLSGTGMDLNWEGPNRKLFRLGISKEQAYPGKTRELDELIDFYEGMIFCGGEWSIRDWMHFQMGGNTYGSQNIEKVNDFIRRKIRPDGFSTFKRGAVPAPLPPSPPPAGVGGNQVDVLARATGLSPQRAGEILPTMLQGLRLAQCTTVPRIAQFIAQTGHESDGYNATEEYAKNGRYAPYIGRTWIMITWDYHYRDFSAWAHARGMVPTPDYFVTNYRALAELRWAGIGAAWYWTEQRPMNALVDAGENASWKAGDRTYRGFEAVTAAINGGLNRLADRRNRYSRALALGDQLLALASSTATTPTPAPAPIGDDELSAEAERMIREMYTEWRAEKRGPSRSFLATDGKGVESPLGFIYNIDGNVWTMTLTWAYLFDVDLAVQVVEKVATTGVYDGSWVQSESFNAWLREFGQEYCQGLVAFKKALVSKLALSNQRSSGGGPVNVVNGPSAGEIAAAVAAMLPTQDTSLYEENARLREEVARLQAVADTKAVAVHELNTITPSRTTGQSAGAVIDSVTEFVNRATQMTPQELEAVQRGLSVMQLSQNGSAK